MAVAGTSPARDRPCPGAIDADVVAGWTAETRERFDADRHILYALGIGAGRSEADVPAVFEGRLRPIPSIAAVLAEEGFWLADPRTGIDWRRALHGEQALTLHRPIPVGGEVVARMRVEGLADKGAGGHAVIRQRRELSDADSGLAIATASMTIVLRGHGGFGGTRGDAAPLVERAAMPDRAPDRVVREETRPEQAALYRLSGDRNPLHVDYDVARAMGFDRPILHGRCTYGFACRAVIAACLDGAGERLRRFDARFTGPVLPGETLATEIWRLDDSHVRFRVRVVDRDAIAIDDGIAHFRSSPQLRRPT